MEKIEVEKFNPTKADLQVTVGELTALTTKDITSPIQSALSAINNTKNPRFRKLSLDL